MSEWLKEHAWKACMWETASRVQIPFSPPLIPSNNIYFVKKYKFNLYLSLVFISVKTQFKKKLIKRLGNSYVFADRFLDSLVCFINKISLCRVLFKFMKLLKIKLSFMFLMWISVNVLKFTSPCTIG